MQELNQPSNGPNPPIDGVHLQSEFLQHVEHEMVLQKRNGEFPAIVDNQTLHTKNFLQGIQVLLVPPLRLFCQSSDIAQELHLGI